MQLCVNGKSPSDHDFPRSLVGPFQSLVNISNTVGSRMLRAYKIPLMLRPYKNTRTGPCSHRVKHHDRNLPWKHLTTRTRKYVRDLTVSATCFPFSVVSHVVGSLSLSSNAITWGNGYGTMNCQMLVALSNNALWAPETCEVFRNWKASDICCGP
jgi:hypothetical protein